MPDTQIWLGKGSNIPSGRCGESSKDYIKPELRNRRAHGREASHPTLGTQGQSQSSR